MPTITAPVLLSRLTIPARERLEAAGNRCKRAGDLYEIELRRPPPGLVLAIVCEPWPATITTGIRCVDEPPYPDEQSAAWHERGQIVACPDCGAALIWHEANYAPGMRLCLGGHASMLSRSGRSAERRPHADVTEEV